MYGGLQPSIILSLATVCLSLAWKNYCTGQIAAAAASPEH